MCMECMQRVCPPNCPNAPEQAEEEDTYALSLDGCYIYSGDRCIRLTNMEDEL